MFVKQCELSFYLLRLKFRIGDEATKYLAIGKQVIC